MMLFIRLAYTKEETRPLMRVLNTWSERKHPQRVWVLLRTSRLHFCLVWGAIQ
jgi:hypothetical protein